MKNKKILILALSGVIIICAVVVAVFALGVFDGEKTPNPQEQSDTTGDTDASDESEDGSEQEEGEDEQSESAVADAEYAKCIELSIGITRVQTRGGLLSEEAFAGSDLEVDTERLFQDEDYLALIEEMAQAITEVGCQADLSGAAREETISGLRLTFGQRVAPVIYEYTPKNLTEEEFLQAFIQG